MNYLACFGLAIALVPVSGSKMAKMAARMFFVEPNSQQGKLFVRSRSAHHSLADPSARRQMKLSDISRKHFDTNWKEILSRKQTISDLCSLAANNVGFFIVKHGSSEFAFVKIADIQTAAQDPKSDTIFGDLHMLWQKVSALQIQKFNPSYDVLVAFEAPPPYTEKVDQYGPAKPVRAWWCHPQTKSTVLINLDHSSRRIEHDAFTV